MTAIRTLTLLATAAAVAGLAVPTSVSAAPSRHRTTGPGITGAVQWTSRPGQPRAGLVHYANGLTARFAERRKTSSGDRVDRRRAARVALTRVASEQRAWEQAAAPVVNGGTVSGTVTDAAGHPLTGVKVHGYGTYSPGRAKTTTDPAGHYTLDLPAGVVTVGFNGGDATGGDSDATGYVGTFERFALAPGNTKSLDATLQPGAVVQIRVTDRAGNPLAGTGPYLPPVQPYVTMPSNVIVSVEYITTDQTAADGTITFRGVSPDATLVCVQAAGKDVSGGAGDANGYADRCARHPIAPGPGTTTTYPTIRLSAGSGGAVSGVVTDDSGTPIAGAYVEPYRPGSEYSSDGLAITAADGSYKIDRIKPGTYRLCVDGVRRAPGRLGFRPGCEPDDVVIGTGTVASAPAIRLDPGGAITGTVTGPAGGPVAGVDVYADAGNWAGRAETGPDGHYRIKGLPSDSYRVCFDTWAAVDPESATGDRPGCYEHRRHIAVRAGAVRSHVDSALRLGGAIAGHIAGLPNSPDVYVEIDIESRTGPAYSFGEVDPSGNFSVGGLPPGSYEACVEMFDDVSYGGSEKCFRTPAEVTAGATTTLDLSVATDAPRGSIQVDVQDADGHPVQGVDVVALKHCVPGSLSGFGCTSEPLFGLANKVRVRAAVEVDNSGRAELTDLKPGNYAVCAFAYYGVTSAGAPLTGYTDRCLGHTFDVAVSAGSVTPETITLHPGGLVTGRVVDGSGHPLAHAIVRVSDSAATNYRDDFGGLGPWLPYSPSPFADSFTGASGQFSIRGVRPGTRTVCVRADYAKGGDSTGGYLDQCAAADVTVTANAETHAPDIALPSGGAITGTVRNAAGHTLHGAGIGVFLPGHVHEAGFAFLDRGPYRMSGLAPGSYLVCFEAYRYKTECYRNVVWHIEHRRRPPETATPVDVAAGATIEIDATLQRRG